MRDLPVMSRNPLKQVDELEKVGDRNVRNHKDDIVTSSGA